MALATGEPSTYFNIYVPPNNDATNRYVALIVTAIQDSTHFRNLNGESVVHFIHQRQWHQR